MILLLDVASPIPEFHLINEDKIIETIRIVQDINQKLSDNIIPKFLNITNNYNFFNNAKKIIITIGPGSYTALRVGASFIAGLNQSIGLPVAIISTETVYEFFDNKKIETGVYFESSNNQKFFSFKRENNFFHEKIENENYILPKFISRVLCNFNSPKFLKENILLEYFSMKDFILKNLNKLNFNKEIIIKPIYISNNTILN